jgi:hypothetical protein
MADETGTTEYRIIEFVEERPKISPIKDVYEQVCDAFTESNKKIIEAWIEIENDQTIDKKIKARIKRSLFIIPTVVHVPFNPEIYELNNVPLKNL